MKINFKALFILLISLSSFAVLTPLESARRREGILRQNTYKDKSYYPSCVASGMFLFPEHRRYMELSNKLGKLIIENTDPANKMFLSNFLGLSRLDEPKKAHLLGILESIEAETNYELAVIFWTQAVDTLTNKEYYNHTHPYFLKYFVNNLSKSKEGLNLEVPTWHPLKQILVLQGPIFGPAGAISFLELAYGIEPTSEISMAISNPPEVKPEPSYFASLTTNLSSIASSTKKLLYQRSSDSDSENEAAKKPIVKKD